MIQQYYRAVFNYDAATVYSRENYSDEIEQLWMNR